MSNFYDKYKELGKMTSDPFILLEVVGDIAKIVYFSASVASLCGYDNVDFAQYKEDDISGLMPEFDKQQMLTVCKKSIASKRSEEIEILLKASDGEYINFDMNVLFVEQHGSKALFYCVIKGHSGIDLNDSLPKLFQMEKRYTNVVNAAHIFVWDYDIVNRRIFNTNDEFKAFGLGSSISNIPYKLIDDGVIPQNFVDDFLGAYDKVRKGVPVVRFEGWYEFKELNNLRYYQVEYHVELDDENNPSIAHGFAIDKTQEMLARDTMDKWTRLYHKMSVNGICTIRIFVNSNKIDLVSYKDGYKGVLAISKCHTIDDFVSCISAMIVDKPDQIRFINLFSRGNLKSSFDESILEKQITFRIRKDESTLCWALARLVLYMNPVSGEIEGAISIENIQDYKLLDLLIKKSISSFEYLIAVNIKSGEYYLYDKNSENSFQSNMGYFERVKMVIDYYEPSPDRDKLNKLLTYEGINNFMGNKRQKSMELTLASKKGLSRRKSITISYLYEDSNEFITILGLDIDDITRAEHKRKLELEDALRRANEANEAKSTFLSLISHDIRTPLNGIMGMLQLALKQNLDPKTTNYLEKSYNSSKYLMDLLSDILDMSAIENGTITYHPEYYKNVEFYNYLDSVIAPLCDKKNISLSISKVNKDNLTVYVDKLRFNQVVFNLLENSVKYTEPGGRIEFTCMAERIDEMNAKLTFKVKDNGIGMSPEFQKHIFEKFSQEKRYENEKNTGSGLGLSIVYRLVEAMNGKISVESKMDVGTTFLVELTLPYIADYDDNLKKFTDDCDDPAFFGKHILVCEDNEINREIVVEQLKSKGCEVDTAKNGDVGVTQFGCSPIGYYSIILMDVRMPVKDGIETTKMIRELRRPDNNIPIIAMTANAMVEDRQQCIDAGMDDYISKPLKTETLFEVMRKYL